MAPACQASDKGERQQEKGIHAAWNGLSNGTDTGIVDILKSMYFTIGLEYWNTGNWKKTGLCMKHIVATEDVEDGSGPNSQWGANMDQEDKELDWSIIGCEMKRL